MSILLFWCLLRKITMHFFGRQKVKSGKWSWNFITKWKLVHTHGGFIRKKRYGQVKTFSYKRKHTSQDIPCIQFSPFFLATDSHSPQKHQLVDTDDSDVWWEKSCGMISKNLMIFQRLLFEVFCGKHFLSNVLYKRLNKQRFWHRVRKFTFIS